MIPTRIRFTLMTGAACAALAACDQPLDFDMRGISGGFSTADAATAPLAARPTPDRRGIISYPTYQVAVARRGDTLTDVAGRVGLGVDELARFNGIDPTVPLRKDEIIALPSRVAESSAPGSVDIAAVAGGAIERVPTTPSVRTAPLDAPATAAPAPQPSAAKEPVRHKVERGETAFTIARLYNVPIKALAEWNGLGADFGIRSGQFLLIPVASQKPPMRTAAVAPALTPLPGQGSATPTPPSATKPLPAEKVAPAVAPTPPTTPKVAEKPVADVGKVTQSAQAARLVRPVTGTIIREYAKGRNEGINIKAAPGTPVKAADVGTVAAITKSAEGIPIVVLRHSGSLLTVYANVTDVAVAKGDSVSRGQTIAKLRSGSDAFVHFEVRKGFDSVDPNPYLN